MSDENRNMQGQGDIYDNHFFLMLKLHIHIRKT